MRETPKLVGLEKQTVVFDLETNGPILRLDGILVLPVGSVIELPDPYSYARVESVRLLTPGGPAMPGMQVCLDCRVTRNAPKGA